MKTTVFLSRRLIGQGINPRVLLPILGETFDELLTTDAVITNRNYALIALIFSTIKSNIFQIFFILFF